MYKLFNEGEEVFSCDDLDTMREEIALMRVDFIREEDIARRNHPEWYVDEASPEEIWVEYFCDTYEVVQVLESENFV